MKRDVAAKVEAAELYDAANRGRWDYDFYHSLIRDLNPSDIADIGCGTGLFAIELAERGRAVTGVDPDAEMLAVAHRGAQTRAAQIVAGGGTVRFVHGEAPLLEPAGFDTIVMTGHVAQVFLTDDAWLETLDAAFTALRPGGRLAFESRDPRAEPWRGWTPEASRRTVHADGEELLWWNSVQSVHDDLVTFSDHCAPAPAEGSLPDGSLPEPELTETGTLRFPSRELLELSLGSTGFIIEQLWGDWGRGPVTERTDELIYCARRP